MFPGHGARIDYNEAGEPLGWDYPSSDDDYDPDDDDRYLPRPVENCIAAGTHLQSCDDDGYCNACGYQDGPDDDE